ncbi:MAG: thiamine-phosphate kinase [Chromatiales bacterium]|nr:thiamine-phosphate kinase [Chromatiales bacterium]
MSVSEFQLIQRYFSSLGQSRGDVILGIGDDCALLRPRPEEALAVSIDTLVEGVHFSPGDDPESLGHKALAVNLSDLAACGAEPAWATLAIALPGVNTERLQWLAGFASGFDALARRYGVSLVGGDTTRGALSITVQVHGFVPDALALRRDGAREGDGIYLSGMVGDAALALRRRQGVDIGGGDFSDLEARLHRPEPRLALGSQLRGVATAAIDVSDGLAADLGHILERSGVGATLDLSALPLSPIVAAFVTRHDDWALPLSGGDDYELCFTASNQHRARLAQLGCHRIGRVTAEPGLRCLRPDGEIFAPLVSGYEHFRHD